MLKIEQEFAIARFEQEVQGLSEAQAKEALVFLHRHYVQQQAIYRQMLGEAWGVLEGGDNARNKTP